MRIVICIKPIKTELVCSNEKRDEPFLLNPYDLKAFGNCLEYKKKHEAEIICLCMGPEDSKQMLLKTLAMGADRAILLNDKSFAGSDTVATSYILALAIKKIQNVDLVVCGEKSVDGETGQVAYGVSERLGFFCVTGVQNIEEITPMSITAMVKKGDCLNRSRIQCPSTIVFQDLQVKQPQISLLLLKKAKRTGITVWTANDIQAESDKIGLNGSRTKVITVKQDFITKDKNVLEGSATDKAKVILDMLLRKRS